MTDLIFNHRTVRKYKSDPIKEAILNQILEAGTRASNTGNMQAYSMVVTIEKTIREKLWEVHFKQNMVIQAPVTITFCADFNRFSKWCEQREATPGFDNFLSFYNASIDALLASQNIALEAESNGLGICYLGTTTYNADKIVQILNLPRLVVPVTTLVMGYPEELPNLTDRLPLKAVVRRETYTDYTPEEIDQIHDERENQPSTLELLKINQKQTLAQIFTDNRYKKEDNVLFSNKYLDVIRQQGFMNNNF